MPYRLITLIYLLLTYSGGLWAPLGSVLIVLVAWLAWREQWADHLGLRVPINQVLIALVAFTLATGAAWIMIPTACHAQGIEMALIWQRDDPLLLALHTLGQTLNEEIVLGWMLLTTLHRKLPLVSLLALSLIVALIFAGLHFAFYAARSPESFNYGLLSAATLLSVFAVGTLRNNLILGTGNIALAWAVHLGWNLIFIDSAYTWMVAGSKLGEPAIFNTVFGYTPIVALLTLLMALGILVCRTPKTKLPIDFYSKML